MRLVAPLVTFSVPTSSLTLLQPQPRLGRAHHAASMSIGGGGGPGPRARWIGLQGAVDFTALLVLAALTHEGDVLAAWEDPVTKFIVFGPAILTFGVIGNRMRDEKPGDGFEKDVCARESTRTRAWSSLTALPKAEFHHCLAGYCWRPRRAGGRSRVQGRLGRRMDR